MIIQTELIIEPYHITIIMTGDPWRENCYVIRHQSSGEIAVIDPGDATDTIIQTILKHGGNLRYILLTHAHHDHVGAVAEISQQFDLPCCLHKADVRLLHHAPMYALRFAQRQIKLPNSFQAFTEWPLLQLGDSSIEIIHTPGHTPGSVCYKFNDFICTGDTLLNQRIGRADLPGASLIQLKESINRLVRTLPDDTIILPGHGRNWTVGEAQVWWQQAGMSPPQYNQLGI